MAEKYWVGGSAISSSWSTSITAPWRTTTGAAFSGRQGTGALASNQITFTDLVGPLAVGHYVYTAPSRAAVQITGLTFNSGSTTAGVLGVNGPARLISTQGMYAHSSNTGVQIPQPADTVIFNAASAYSTTGVLISCDTQFSISTLTLQGFRGKIQLPDLIVTGGIVWPITTASVINYAYIRLVGSGASAVFINNNGNTFLNNILSKVYYIIDGATAGSATPPDNIIAQEVIFEGTVNLSNKIIEASTITADTGSVINPGTSTLRCNTYIPNSVNAYTLYNVEAMEPFGFSGKVYTQPLPGLTYNSLSLTYNPEAIEFDEIYIDDCTLNNLNIQYPNSPQYQESNLLSNSSGIPATITKQGGGSTMLQIGFVLDCIFQPPGTFFTVGADFTGPEFNNTNIRPSPSPLNFL